MGNNKQKRQEVTFEDFEFIQSLNTKLSGNFLKGYIRAFKSFFDIQQKLFYNNVVGIYDNSYDFNEYEKVAMQAYVKNIYLCYSVHTLLLKGHYGSANILQRQIFEFLLLGKYTSIKRDNNLADKWLNNHQFDIYNNIIKMLDKPNKKMFHDFWLILCNFTHATTNSNQVGITFKKNNREIYKSYSFLLLLLRCNYHLLNSHVLNKRLLYRTSIYENYWEKNIDLKIEARTLKKAILIPFSKLGRTLIKNYESKWKFKK